MAIHNVVAVKDTALDGFLPPFTVPSIPMAVRSFSDEVVKTDSPMFAHPEDYALFDLGTFDTDSGVFSPKTPEQIIRAKDIVSHH